MPVYRRTDTKTAAWWIRFQIGGRRIHEPTGAKTKAEAERIERDRRREVERELARPSDTLDRIAGRWWNEIGQYRRDAETCDLRIARLIEGIGAQTRLRDISFDVISSFVAQRRRTPTQHGKLPAAATVNREVQILRTVLRRAQKWGQDVPLIDWGALLQSEPQERVVCLSDYDEKRICDQLPDDWRRLFAFLIISGWRISAATNLRWHEVGEIIETTGKGGRRVILPIDDYIGEILEGQSAAHETHVFAMKARRTLKGRTMRGIARPIDAQLARNEWYAACDRAGVARVRVHDLRHTAATRTLSATGNLRIVQTLLGHARITTTTKYAHILEARELEEAMAVTRERRLPHTRRQTK